MATQLQTRHFAYAPLGGRASAAAGARSLPTGRKWVLAVGINNIPWPRPLQNAVNAATAVVQSLQSDFALIARPPPTNPRLGGRAAIRPGAPWWRKRWAYSGIRGPSAL